MLASLASSLGMSVLIASCSGPNRVALPASSVPVSASGAAEDITVSKWEQDPNDSTQVTASGSINDHLSSAADYDFTIEWYLGSMLATTTSVAQKGVVPNAPVGWTTETGLALATGGPYTCRITRVTRTPES